MIRLRNFMHYRTIMQHLIMYLCVSLVVIVILLPIFFIACENAEKIIAQEQIQNVSQGFLKLQSSIKQCQTHAYNLACNTDIVRLSLSNEDDSSLALRLYNLTLYQRNNFWESDLVSEVIIQFARNGALLTRTSVYQDKSVFYNQFFSYGDLAYDQWQQSLFADKKDALDTTLVSYNGNQTKAFTLNYYYPSVSNPLIVISFIIPADQLFSTLMTDEIRDYGSLSLTIGKGDTPLHLSYDSGCESCISLLSLSNLQSRMTLEARLSDDVYTEANSSLRYTLIIYVLSSFVVSTALSIVFTRLNMRPLRTMISFISQLGISAGEYQGNAYSYIRQALAGAIDSEEQLKKAYELTQTSLEHTVFNMAVKGLSVEPHHLKCALGHIPAFKDGYVLVGVAGEPLSNDWPSGYDPEIALVTARRLFIERTQKTYLYESNILYAVLSVKAHEKESIPVLLEDLRQTLSDKLGAGLCIGVSREFSDPNRLGEAADQVDWALKNARSGGSARVVCYEPVLPISSEHVVLNEEMLFQLLMQEEKSRLEDFLASLLHAVCREYRTALYAKTCYYSVVAVCQRVLDAISGGEDIVLREYDTRLSVRNNMVYIGNVCVKIQDTTRAHRHAQRQDLMHSLLDYIKDQYASPYLSLTMVADHFSLSERYLSTLIREQTGLNYSDYITDIRIIEARRLLSQTDTPINNIAGCVGYDRVNSFYKSFKRYTGLSPRQYRINTQAMGS